MVANAPHSQRHYLRSLMMFFSDLESIRNIAEKSGFSIFCVPNPEEISIKNAFRIMPGKTGKITKEQADSLLRSDFRQAIRTAERLTNLKGSRKLAVAHFIFSKGCGAFSKSTLRKEIALNGDIDREFMRWCWYTKPGTKQKVKSKVAEGISRWECKMWHRDDNLYAWGRYFE